VGLDYTYDFTDTDKAACSILITDPKIFDGRVILDEDTEVMDRRAGDNEYFHRDFHSSTNRGIRYLGEKYGETYIVDYLTQYTKHVYAHLNIPEKGLNGIENLLFRKQHLLKFRQQFFSLRRKRNTFCRAFKQSHTDLPFKGCKQMRER
jgi:hypothetical protein